MAVHPIHPLLVVCDDSQNIYLHRINADQPQLMHLPLFHLGQYLHASCIAFHSTLPLVAASSDETNLITFWNIQEVIDRLDEVPFNVEERRSELEQLIEQLGQGGDANQIEELEEELDNLDNYAETPLNSFATVTTVNPSYITFHPTMPYIVVGCVNFDMNYSVIQTFQVTPPPSPPVEVSSIVIPMDQDDPYKKIESITFSPDGLFLAATFGKTIIVWFFSPTQDMMKQQLINLLLTDIQDVKTLVFSPREYILVGGITMPSGISGIMSFKIEKCIENVPNNLTTVEGWTATKFAQHTTESTISTLAFHPTLPLLVCGFVNGYVKFYIFDSDDNILEITKNPIPFDGIRQGKHNVPPPMPSVALNRKFLVTCDSDEVRVYTMYGVESVVERFGDKLRDMSMAARKSLYRKGIPEGVRDLILNKTSYGNSLKGSIAFFKRTMVKKGFLDHPVWLLGIMQQFIDLLKLTPNLPPILIPFQEIITNYYPSPYRGFTNPEYKQTCNEIVEHFITRNNLNHKSADVQKIKDFFNSVVDVLVTHRVNLRRDIQNTFITDIFPILQELFTLNQSETNHRFIRDIDLKELLEYEKAKRAFTRKHNEDYQQGGRKKKKRARTYKKKRTRARHGFH